MAENTRGIIAIVLLAAAQGMDFRRPLISSAKVEEGDNIVRNSVSFYDQDRYFSPDINAICDLIREGDFRTLVKDAMVS
ncbi:MAG: histidine ammonia-lyase [Granulosicoccus sp.]|jgi:histidine ammonia-lyase